MDPPVASLLVTGNVVIHPSPVDGPSLDGSSLDSPSLDSPSLDGSSLDSPSLDSPPDPLRWLRSVSAPPRNDEIYYRVCCQLKRHLRDSRKPLIVMVTDSAESESVRRVVAAYGSSAALRNAADLVLTIADASGAADPEQRCERSKQLLLDIDRHDLYGNVAIYHPREPGEEIVELLRIASDRRGVTLVAGAKSDATRLSASAGRTDGAAGRDPTAIGEKGADDSVALGAAVELLSGDLGVPVVAADSEDLVDLCGAMLVDPEGWAELSEESQQAAADRRLQICRSEYAALGSRLLETRRRRCSRSAGILAPVAGTAAAAAG